MAISSSNSSSSSDSEVQKCSKCLESFKCLQKNYDTKREKHNKSQTKIMGYENSLETIERPEFLGHEKNELAWGERYEFQNYDLKCREIKINNLNMELEKVVKERDELKLKIEKWEGSSKNLHRYSIVRSSDEESTLANNRFTKANEYHVVPLPITGNPLTPRADISFAGLDEYAFRNKIIESKTTKTNKIVGTTNEASIVKPKSVNETVVSKSKINRDEVIIGDWTLDDEDDVCVVKAVSSVKPNVTQAVRSQANKSDCDFYDQKSPDHRAKNMVNTGKRVVKPVWDYNKRVNHQNFSNFVKYPYAKRTFNPSAVLTRAGLVNTDRSNVSTARSISTVRPRPLASKIAQSNSVIRPNHPRLDINGVAERKNKTLIEAARTMLADSLLPIPFWAEAVNIACYVLNRVLVTKPQNKTPYELLIGTGPNWMFDLDFLTNSMNYIPVSVENQVIVDASTQDSYVVGSSRKDKGSTQEYILLPLQPHRIRRRIASQKKAAQATSTNQLSTNRPFVSIDRSFVSTDRSNTPNVSAASTSTGANADGSSFVYLGG
ncbi:ribonuclease H-like domain-containing protein [Tanacetum coccineum]